MKFNSFSVSIRFALFACFSLAFFSARSSNPSLHKMSTMQRDQGLFFEENKGQISDPTTKFFGHSNDVYLFCKPGIISFVFTKVEKASENISEATGTTEDESALSPFGGGRGRNRERETEREREGKITSSRMDLVFINANPSPIFTATNRQEYYENFYTIRNSDSGITKVHTYKTITYINIYPHIDLILKAKGKGMEYSFLVHPGGKVDDIQMRWDGTANTKLLTNGRIGFDNQLGNIEESAPKSFADGKELKSSFSKNKESFGFKVGKYDQAKDLLIDPTLVWATYFGGNDMDDAYGITTDLSGNIYITGSTRSTVGLATSGAFQTSYGLNSSVGQYGYGDAFLAKFNSSGNLKWATYFGGGHEDDGFGVATDASGNVYMTGATYSSDLIASFGAYQTILNGPEDAFIAKFDDSGVRQWSTYYGGSSFDGAQSISIDNSNSIYITGATRSTDGIATSGAYQTYYDGRSNGEAFLARFTSSGNLDWGTYHGASGGNGNGDYGSGVSADAFGNVYITGYTYCETGVATSGAYLTSKPGYINAFLSRFNDSGKLLWGTYYGGNDFEYAGGVCTDASGNIYITGYTSSTNGIATAGAYQTVMAGSVDAYIAKFDSSCNLKWGTYFGGSNSDEAFGLCPDAFGNVYISGYTSSNSNIATIGAYQTSLTGAYDAFLAKFTGSGALAYATYYGGTGSNYGYGVNVYGSGNIYVTGYTSSSNGIATSGSFHTTYYGGYDDAFLAKFGIKIKNDAGIKSIVTLSNNFCSDSGSFQLRLANYGNADLDSVNIFLSVNGVLQKKYHWVGKLQPDSTQSVDFGKFLLKYKTDTIRAWTSLPNGFLDSLPSNDSVILIDNQVGYPYANTGGNHPICYGSKISLGASPTIGHSYSWLSIPSGFTSSISNPIVSPTATTTYYLTETVSNTTCRRIDSAKITVNPIPAPSAGLSETMCAGDNIFIGSSAISGHIYSWKSVPSGYVSSNAKNKISPAATTQYYLTETITATGCANLDSVEITVNPLPPAKTTFSQSICTGDSIAIGYAYTQGDSYQWTSSPAGFYDTLSNPFVRPKSQTTYLLTESTAKGCTKSGSVTISVNPIPTDPGIRTKDSVCLGQSVKVQFHPSSYINYVWSSVPSGFSSNDSSITLSPKTATAYILTQTIPASDCERKDTIKISVNPLPAPSIKGDSAICGIGKAIYQTTAVTGDSYVWQTKSGQIISGQNSPEITVGWDSIKTSMVKVVETNIHGCSNTASMSVLVANKPVAGFYFQNVCLGNPEYFKDSSTNAASWAWNFGDSTTSAVENVFHVFSHAGTYHVSEIIKSINGCADTAMKTATVYQTPSLNWTIKRDTGRSILYSVSDSSFAYYSWNFGDGALSSIYFGSHIYSKDDIYNLSLKVVNNHGCTTVLDTSITIDFYSQLPIGIYPNPFRDHVYVNYALSKNSQVGLVLYDALGRVVRNFFNEMQASGNYSFNIISIEPNLAPGIYFLKFIVNGNVTVAKLAKEN